MLASTTGGVGVNGERRPRAPAHLHEHIIAIKSIHAHAHGRKYATTHARALGMGSLARHESQLNQLKTVSAEATG